jgi:hypothetical protein
MGQPVVHFEVIGKDGEKLRGYYSELFGWEFGDPVGPTNYAVVPRDGNTNADGVGPSQGPLDARFRLSLHPKCGPRAATRLGIGERGGRLPGGPPDGTQRERFPLRRRRTSWRSSNPETGSAGAISSKARIAVTRAIGFASSSRMISSRIRIISSRSTVRPPVCGGGVFYAASYPAVFSLHDAASRTLPYPFCSRAARI